MPSTASRPAASVDRAVARLGRRIGAGRGSPGWTAPEPALLIGRIEAALAERRAAVAAP